MLLNRAPGPLLSLARSEEGIGPVVLQAANFGFFPASDEGEGSKEGRLTGMDGH